MLRQAPYFIMADNSNNTTDKSTPQDDRPRQEIINTAVTFLQNPTVQRSSAKYKRAFLKTKGLTDEEINIAFEKSSSIIAEKQSTSISGNFSQVPNGTVIQYSYPPQSPWMKLRDLANTIIIIGGLSYGAFILYKKYILPWLSGGNNQKSVEQSITELDEVITASVQELRDSINKVHADLKILHQRNPADAPATVKQIEELKAEIASVKGLLLNRNQFALPVTKSPLTPPSIPAWQLSATECAKDADGGGPSSKVDADIEDICLSGSGSSETELVTNNGSDSSLEMIRE